MICFKSFKSCLPQILLGPFLNTLSQMKQQFTFCSFAYVRIGSNMTNLVVHLTLFVICHDYE